MEELELMSVIFRAKEIYQNLMEYIDEDPEVIGSAICLFLDSYQYKHGIDLKLDEMRKEVFAEMGDRGAEV